MSKLQALVTKPPSLNLYSLNVRVYQGYTWVSKYIWEHLRLLWRLKILSKSPWWSTVDRKRKIVTFTGNVSVSPVSIESQPKILFKWRQCWCDHVRAFAEWYGDYFFRYVKKREVNERVFDDRLKENEKWRKIYWMNGKGVVFLYLKNKSLKYQVNGLQMLKGFLWSGIRKILQ